MKTSLYIHIPFCKTRCTYCDFFSTACGNNPVPDEYIQALCNEIQFKKEYYQIEEFFTVYVGGGTPSLLSENQIKRLSAAIYQGCSSRPVEFTFEVNPDDVSVQLLSCLESCGVTRISCGIQSLNKDALSYVRRRSSAEVAENALALIKENWNGSFSADLISGLPQESQSSFLETLSVLVSYFPDHISMYSLTLEEGTVLGDSVFSGRIDYDYEKADKIWLKGRDFLKEKGYFQYEVSNFSRPGRESLHNMTYWKLGDYIGCGAGATGTLYGLVSKRFTNTKNLESYKKFWTSQEIDYDCRPGELETIDEQTQEFEFFMMGLRTIKGVSDNDFYQRFNRKIPEKILNQFKVWEAKGLCEIRQWENSTVYSLGEKGILFLNAFLEELL